MNFSNQYEQYLVGPIFKPFAESTLDLIHPQVGERVLDVACGTGIVARLARERVGDNGYVVGVDVSQEMLAVARSIDERIDWRQGSAEHLPITEGEQFDIVTCQQGIQFMKEKHVAVKEMRRALKDGGRIAVSAWRSDEESPPLLMLRRVAERHVGSITDRRHSFSDPGALETLMRDAGFLNVRNHVIEKSVRFDDATMFVRMNAMALVGMSSVAQTLTEQERNDHLNRILDESLKAVGPYMEGNAIVYPIATNVAIADM